MTVEFSRLVMLDEIGDGIDREIAASETECAALARRFDLRAVTGLSGRFRIAPAAGGIRVTGTVEAAAIQACVISGEDVGARVSEPVDLVYHSESAKAEELELEQGDCDVLPLEGRSIDLGELAAQTLGLALDPYPRADAARLEAARLLLLSEEQAEREAARLKAKSNPFAVLKGGK